jgi:hypothetical protein
MYIYDGDGNMVKSVFNGKSTYFLGKLYQKKIDGATATVQKYYSSGSAPGKTPGGSAQVAL